MCNEILEQKNEKKNSTFEPKDSTINEEGELIRFLGDASYKITKDEGSQTHKHSLKESYLIENNTNMKDQSTENIMKSHRKETNENPNNPIKKRKKYLSKSKEKKISINPKILIKKRNESLLIKKEKNISNYPNKIYELEHLQNDTESKSVKNKALIESFKSAKSTHQLYHLNKKNGSCDKSISNNIKNLSNHETIPSPSPEEFYDFLTTYNENLKLKSLLYKPEKLFIYSSLCQSNNMKSSNIKQVNQLQYQDLYEALQEHELRLANNKQNKIKNKLHGNNGFHNTIKFSEKNTLKKTKVSKLECSSMNEGGLNKKPSITTNGHVFSLDSQSLLSILDFEDGPNEVKKDNLILVNSSLIISFKQPIKLNMLKY